jgi:hypothetical protein
VNSRGVAITVALLLVTSGCTSLAPPVEQSDQTGDRIGEIDPPEDVADPDRDRLGWEDGYWYDEQINVSTEDGLSEREQAAVIGRTMARIEYIRGLEFTEPVPVTVMSREQFRSRQANRTIPDQRRQQLNVTYEALFMINSSTDAATVLNQNAGSSVGGYYSPTQNQIVVIGDGPESLLLNERTLAHELLHALQNQHFDLTRYDQRTIDRNNAISGLVEGDARFLEHTYRQRCERQWDCFAANGGGGGGQLTNIGPYLITFQPYSDGPSFVRHHYRQGGWAKVNRLYTDPPTTSGQTIHPERYPQDQAVRPRVTDRAQGSWDRIEVDGQPTFAELGVAGTTAMLVYPGYESNGETQIVPLQEFVNTRDGSTNRFDPLNYDTRYTDGLRGDRLVPYRNAAGETGYVWSLSFESAAGAVEFREGYRRLLQYRNATTVETDGPGTTYRIATDDANNFGATFRVVQDGNRLIITNAPTIEQLNDVRRPPKQRASQTVERTEPAVHASA